MHRKLLSLIGEVELTEGKMKEVEKFVFKMDHVGSVDESRVILFLKKGQPGALPLTSDASSLHVKRVPYQAIVWKQAHCSEPAETLKMEENC